MRHFIYSVITSSRAKISALLVALAYLDRTKSRLDPHSFGRTWGRERIFIAALILATKVRLSFAYRGRNLTSTNLVPVRRRSSAKKPPVGPHRSDSYCTRDLQRRNETVARTRLGFIDHGGRSAELLDLHDSIRLRMQSGLGRPGFIDAAPIVARIGIVYFESRVRGKGLRSHPFLRLKVAAKDGLRAG